MLSETTLRRLLWALKLATFLQLTSFSWDNSKRSFVLTGKPGALTFRTRFYYVCNKGCHILNVVYRIGLVLFLVLNLSMRNDVYGFEAILTIYFLTILGLALPTSILLLIWDFKVVNYLNALLRLNSKMIQTFQFNAHGKDGLESISTLIFIISFVTTIIELPVAVFHTLRNGPFYRFFNSKQIGGGPVLSVWIATFFALQFIIDAVCIIIITFIILNHTNVFTKWLTVCTNELSNPKVSSGRKRMILGLFRSLQVVHNMTTDVTSFILPTIIPAAEALIIAAAYSSIRLSRKSDFSLVLALANSLCGMLAVLILNLAITFAVNVTEASKEFVESGYKIRFQRRRYFDLYLKSCRPLYWNIGGTFVLGRATFLGIMHGIVINILINLLLVF